jgi:hypothetical protein
LFPPVVVVLSLGCIQLGATRSQSLTLLRKAIILFKRFLVDVGIFLKSLLDQRKDEAIERTFKQVSREFHNVFEKLVPAGRGHQVV